jgi:hypothetical protein
VIRSRVESIAHREDLRAADRVTAGNGETLGEIDVRMRAEKSHLSHLLSCAPKTGATAAIAVAPSRPGVGACPTALALVRGLPLGHAL